MNFDLNDLPTGLLNLSNIPNGMSGRALATADANSPEIFHQNVKVAMQYVDLIQRLSRSAAAGMCVTYSPLRRIANDLHYTFLGGQ